MRFRDLIVLLALGACGDDASSSGPSPLDSIDDDPRAAHYPTERLPWTAAPGTNAPTGLISEDTADQSYPVLQPRAVVLGYGATATDARVVAIVPTTEGLSIAVAGMDHPWERVAVGELTIDTIGALDAVLDADQTVHLFVREKGVAGQLRYFRWREGGAVMEQPRTPAIPGAVVAPYAEDCTDVSTAIDRHGRPAVTFTVHSSSDGPKVYLARQEANGAWTTAAIASSYPGTGGLSIEAGCRTLLRADEAGYLRFATLRRTLPIGFSPTSEVRWNLPKSTFNGAETVDGRFVPTSGVTDTDAGSELYEYSGLFDLHADSFGVLWPSPYASSHAMAMGASISDPVIVRRADNRDRGAVVGGKIYVNECRAVTQFVDATLTPFSVRWGMHGCHRPTSPPVVARGVPLVEPVHVVWTRGTSPFFTGLCVDAEGTIALCGPTVAVEEDGDGICRPTPDELLPAVTAASVQPGAELALGAAWKLEAAPVEVAETGWVLQDLDTIHADLSSEDIPASTLIINGAVSAAPLQAGHRYRAALSASADTIAVYLDQQRTCAYPWLYPLAGLGSPELTFRVAGSRVTDPRDVRPALDCDALGTRASDGACEMVANVTWVDGWYDVVAPFTGELDQAQGSGSVTADGQPYANVMTNIQGHQMLWRLPAPVDVDKVYTLTPVGLAAFWGGPGPDPATSTIRLRFPLAPLRIISSMPLQGATGVAVDAEVGFELSVPASIGVVKLGPTSGTLVTVSPQQTSATAWRVPHAAFAPNTSYTLELMGANAGTDMLVPPVFTLVFTTAP